MTITSLLIANRGEIAIRIARAAAERGLRTVAVYSEDDARSLHTRRADQARLLRGSGAAAYLDIGQLVATAREAGCDAIHPGYGFQAENPDFAIACAEAGIRFVGPRPDVLAVFGDKARARALARSCGIPVLPGSEGPAELDQALAFQRRHGAVMIKAIAGGGGRGMRAVRSAEELEAAYPRCRSEAKSAFGNDEVYLEALLPRARHVEVQIVGDGSGAVVHLWERECSVQRRNQKLVEIAPSPGLDKPLRAALARRRGASGRGRALRQSGHDRVPRRSGRAARRARLRVHRGERAPAGRAHGDRGGDRNRPRPRPARAGRGTHARRARARSGLRHRAARLRASGARSTRRR